MQRVRNLAWFAPLALALATAMPAGALAVQRAVPLRTEPVGPPPGPATPTPSLFSVPNPSSESELYGDTCIAPSDCWAVGSYANGAARLGQVIHFLGRTWSRALVPEPGFTAPSDYDYLTAVSCTSSSQCWAVGYHGNRRGASVNEVLHWNGAKWWEVTVPQPAGIGSPADQNRLYGITCTARANCWAVGDRTNGAGAYLNEALHWNGHRWGVAATPNPYGTASSDQNVAYGVSCTSRAECISVGYGRNVSGAYVNEALRWNGQRWATMSIPQPGGTHGRDYGYLEGLACPAAGECLAAGGYQSSPSGSYLNEVLLWNRTNWGSMTLPDPGGSGSTSGAVNELTALSCVSASNCWAVGYYDNSRGAELNDALHWDGQSWSSVATPQPGGISNNSEGSVLYGLSCASSSACLAVGYAFKTTGRELNQALQWDGASWSLG